jgi:hypothetical protein
VSAGLTRLNRSLALMTPIKNLGRHTTPPGAGVEAQRRMRARPSSPKEGEGGDRAVHVTRTNLKHRKVAGLSAFRKVYRICEVGSDRARSGQARLEYNWPHHVYMLADPSLAQLPTTIRTGKERSGANFFSLGRVRLRPNTVPLENAIPLETYRTNLIVRIGRAAYPLYHNLNLAACFNWFHFIPYLCSVQEKIVVWLNN